MCLPPVSSPLTGPSTHCTHRPEGCARALASGSSLPHRMRRERSNVVFPLGPTSLPQHPSMPAGDPVPCSHWAAGHGSRLILHRHSGPVPLAECLGHLCAPVPGDSEHWDLVPAHRIQVIVQGQQDLRRKVKARVRSCCPGRSSFQIFRPCLYGRYSQIHESFITAAASQLPHNSCVTHSPRGNLRPEGTDREDKGESLIPLTRSIPLRCQEVEPSRGVEALLWSSGARTAPCG